MNVMYSICVNTVCVLVNYLEPLIWSFIQHGSSFIQMDVILNSCTVKVQLCFMS